MVYTSYLGNLKKIPSDMKKISIMRHTPKWANEYIDDIDLKLAPSEKLLYDYKSGKLTKEEYTAIFKKEVLDKIDSKKLYRKYNNKVLLCSCKAGVFCHRHLIADKLKEDGYDVQEHNIDLVLQNHNAEIVKKIVPSMVKKFPDKIYVVPNILHNDIRKNLTVFNNVYNLYIGKSIKKGFIEPFKDTISDTKYVLDGLFKILNLALPGTTIVFEEGFLNNGLKELREFSPHLYIKVYLILTETLLKDKKNTY